MGKFLMCAMIVVGSGFALASNNSFTTGNGPEIVSIDTTPGVCKDGARITVDQPTYDTDREVRVQLVCMNGTYMTAAEIASYVRNPNAVCTEGQKVTEEKYYRGADYKFFKECVNGKYKVIRKSRVGRQ